MKTFRELISWELEQESKKRAAALSLSEHDRAAALNASVLRKLRYLHSGGTGGQKASVSGFSAA